MIKALRIILPPVIFLFYLVLAIFIRNKFPDVASLIRVVEGVYETIGYPLIFFGALFESMFLIGLFVPGSVVLLTGAALSRLGVVEYQYVYILGTLGLLIGYTINYFLGYHVLSFLGLEKGLSTAKDKLRKYEYKALLLGYIFPGSGSLLSTAAGVMQMDFKKFVIFSFISQGFWSFVWGSVAYIFGMQIVEFVFRYFVFVVLGVVLIWGIKRFIVKHSSKTQTA